jgi:hypothetical protein
VVVGSRAQVRLIIGLIGVLTVGCAGYTSKITQARQSYFAGDFAAAEQEFVERATLGKRAAPVVALERASIAFANGDPRAAERLWRAARDELDELRGFSASESVTALLADDRQRSYLAPGYEQVMVRVMLSLSSLLHDGIDAEAYMLQAELRQRELAEQAEAEYSKQESAEGTDETIPKLKPVAFASYLRGVLQEASYLNIEEARQAYAETLAACGENQLVQNDLVRLNEGSHSQTGFGVLYVIGLTGRGPIRREEIAEPTSAALLIADRIISAFGTYSLPPSIAPVKIPGVELPPHHATYVQVKQQGKRLGLTETITDVGQLATECLAAERNRLIAQAVVRRIVKKGMVVAGKDALGLRDPATQFAVDMLGVAWEATEAADTRCWSLLPRQIQVARIELPAGKHSLDVSVAGHPMARGRTRRVRCQIEDGYNTYLVVVAPENEVLTAIVSGRTGIALEPEGEVVRLTDAEGIAD